MAKVACVGAGTVGRAWAVVFARAGHEVHLFDAKEGQARKAIAGIQDSLALLQKEALLTEPVATILARIDTVSTIEDAARGAYYIQESIREDAGMKRQVFADLAKLTPEACLLASSTSALPGSEFLGEIKHPERALVAHPVNPPSLIPLVELCASPWTSDRTLDRAKSFLEAAGMKPIIVRKEIEGFILNRLQYTLVAEAMHLVGEGYCTAADIDRVMTDGLALRWASIGPFLTAHLNATGGFAGFVEQLEPMMKTIGASAKPDYDWEKSLSDQIHKELSADTPVSNIPAKQAWRDQRILAVRKLQDDKKTRDQ